MHTFLRGILVFSLASLAACGTFSVQTDPGAFDVDPALLAGIRAKAVTLENGNPVGTKTTIRKRPLSWEIDLKNLTDTGISMLGRSMERRGIAVGGGDKRIVLLVRPISVVQGTGIFDAPNIQVRVAVDARFADGTGTYVEGEGGTYGGGAQRAVDNAVQVAIQQLVAEPKFIAYLNQ